MLFLCLGDLHITDRRPGERTDDYTEAQFRKLSYAFRTAKQAGVTAVLQPGDFFDKHICSNFILQKAISFFRHYGLPIFVTPGQHDMKYHSSNIQDSPLSVMEAAGIIHLVRENRSASLGNEVYIHAAGWGEELPGEESVDSKHCNIILTHRMIIHKEKLWEAQKDYDKGGSLLRNNDFDLIVSGDNHQNFYICIQRPFKKFLLNSGSLMRSTTAQLDHVPKFYIYDTEESSIQEYTYPAAAIEKVFNIIDIKEKKEKETELKSFVEKISGTSEITGLDFVKNLDVHLASVQGVCKETINEINSVLEEVS